MLQLAHLMRVPSKSASQWLQRWNGTQRQPRQFTRSHYISCWLRWHLPSRGRHVGTQKARSQAQRLRQDVAHHRVIGAESCPSRSGCGSLWRIGALAARHRVWVELRHGALAARHHIRGAAAAAVSGCVRLWHIGVSTARHCIWVELIFLRLSFKIKNSFLHSSLIVFLSRIYQICKFRYCTHPESISLIYPLIYFYGWILVEMCSFVFPVTFQVLGLLDFLLTKGRSWCG